MSGEYTEAQKKANIKYRSKHDMFRVVMEPELGQSMRDHVKETGESLNAFVNRAIQETIERDAKKK